MRIKTGASPLPDKDAKLTPGDFSTVLQAVPANCVLIGGQAVAWWAGRYGIKAVVKGQEQEVTSNDIDFWGTHEDLLELASHLQRKPVLPGRHEITLLLGSIALETKGKKTALEVLHHVPGLDSANPLSAAVPAGLPTAGGGREFLVLSPVSLVLAKLHALRHFSQEQRQDLAHLQVSLKASKMFIAEALKQSARLALWNCNRLIDAHRQKPNQKLEQKHGFQILSAVPIDSVRSEARLGKPEDRRRLQRFLSIQWPKIIAAGQMAGSEDSAQ
jgi:hypothetical protein